MIEGSVDLATFKFASGWAADLENPEEKVTIKVICDNREIASTMAAAPREDLLHLCPEGKIAFSVNYPEQQDVESIKFVAENERYGKLLHVIKRIAMKTGYQTFEDQKGDSDSYEKLTRLGIPERLDGKSILDLGCNEGFFCINAMNRGATDITGIDQSSEYIERARGRCGKINFIEGSWWNVPDKKYDLILFLSAFHYEKNPKELLDMLADHLTPDGTLILECGIAPFPNETWLSVQRGDGVFRYPSRPLLLNTLLNRYYTRFHSQSIDQPGDPLHRFVFHACLKKPMVIFLSGAPLQGKTVLSSVLASSARVVEFSIDVWMWQLRNAQLPLPSGNPIYADIKSHCEATKVKEFIDFLPEQQCRNFADALAWALPLDADCVVMEGYPLERDEISSRLEEILQERGVRIWRLSRI